MIKQGCIQCKLLQIYFMTADSLSYEQANFTDLIPNCVNCPVAQLLSTTGSSQTGAGASSRSLRPQNKKKN